MNQKLKITLKKTHPPTTTEPIQSDTPKPILKWIGGKTQILDKIIQHIPNKMNNYHEIFLGGGSVLFMLLTHIENGSIQVKNKIYAYDINEPLIYMYKNIQSNHIELYNTITVYIDTLLKCKENGPVNRDPNTIEEAQSCRESYYYWIRKQYNQLSDTEKKTVKGSSIFIFLNKTCFRGMFRLGPNGYNVPYGNYKNPAIVTLEHLTRVSQLIKNVDFICADFENSLSTVTKDDFVYLDPPYAPENTKSFVKYYENGFNTDQHIKLFKMINNLPCHFLLSNSNVKLVHENFTDTRFTTDCITCRRAINSKDPSSQTKEVLIYTK